MATRNGQTYFVTSNTAERTPFFRHDRWVKLFIETMYGYQHKQFLLHAFVVMPDHFHLLITPQESLERSVQCIKGGFSFRAKKDLSWTGNIWVAGFTDHRIRDHEDFEIHQSYIARNPVKSGLTERPQDYPYSSATGLFHLDTFPQGLKPRLMAAQAGAAKAAPFQNKDAAPNNAVQERRE
ncbi:REP-associated tyrosine transposase [Granulicella arctica]|uniref:Putative transposase n=1 Tax=Granulicella arctica TaxID=940613 RepID=A0A7Y9PII2_9BACT|nr:putative transposase [Granulicella arctica]